MCFMNGVSSECVWRTRAREPRAPSSAYLSARRSMTQTEPLSAQRKTDCPSRLEVERRRVRAAWGAGVLGVHLARRNVSHPFAHDPYALGGGRLAHRGNAELPVHQDLPDLLPELAALSGFLARGGLEQFERPQELRVLGRLPLLAVAGVPARNGVSEERLRRVRRHRVPRIQEELLDAVRHL